MSQSDICMPNVWSRFKEFFNRKSSKLSTFNSARYGRSILGYIIVDIVTRMVMVVQSLSSHWAKREHSGASIPLLLSDKKLTFECLALDRSNCFI